MTASWREDGNTSYCLDEASLRHVSRALGAATIARGIELDDSDENTLEVTITDKADNSTTYPVSPATHETKLDENLNGVYEYDAVGNVKKKTEVVDYDVGGGGTYITRYFYDDANRLEYIDYNWTTATLRVAWTKLSLRRVSRLGGDVHYVYDPVGQRVKIEYGQVSLSGENYSSFSASTARGFVCFGGQILEEWTVSGGSLDSLAYRYVRNPATGIGGGIRSIIYQIDAAQGAGDYRYYHYNHKGDTAALTDASKNIIAWYEYDAWGNVATDWEASGVENEFRFSTKQWDATPPDANGTAPDAGLIYFGARSLDPDLGRWTQMDPGGTVDGLNMYVYVTDQPIGIIDSLGYGGKLIIDTSCAGHADVLRRSHYAYGPEHWAWSTGYNKDDLEGVFDPIPTKPDTYGADLVWWPGLPKGWVKKITDWGTCTVYCECDDKSVPEKEQFWYATIYCRTGAAYRKAYTKKAIKEEDARSKKALAESEAALKRFLEGGRKLQ